MSSKHPPVRLRCDTTGEEYGPEFESQGMLDGFLVHLASYSGDEDPRGWDARNLDAEYDLFKELWYEVWDEVIVSCRETVPDVRFAPDGDGRYRVFTPFCFDDGDHLSIVLKPDGDDWALSDEGYTLMRSAATSLGQYADVKRRPQIEDRDGELVLVVRDGEYGDALLLFVQALLGITGAKASGLGRLDLETGAALVNGEADVDPEQEEQEKRRREVAARLEESEPGLLAYLAKNTEEVGAILDALGAVDLFPLGATEFYIVTARPGACAFSKAVDERFHLTIESAEAEVVRLNVELDHPPYTVERWIAYPAPEPGDEP